MIMDYRNTLLEAADKHCRATGKSRSTLANLVANDGKFFDRIERGGGCTMDTFENVMRWFSENPAPTTKQPRTGASA